MWWKSSVRYFFTEVTAQWTATNLINSCRFMVEILDNRFFTEPTAQIHIISCCRYRSGQIAQLVRVWGVTLGTGVRISVMAITFNCAAIHFLAVYNLQRHQRPVPLIPSL